MKNSFTKEDIKNSVEYQWRGATAKWLIVLWAVISVVVLFSLVMTRSRMALRLLVWLLLTVIYSAVLLPFVAFYRHKMAYLLKNYEQFNSYEVMLDNISTSYMYKGAVYYTVTICDDGVTKRVRTNPYFSSAVFARFALEDYNNKKVVGLYDGQMDKFYIIKKVN